MITKAKWEDLNQYLGKYKKCLSSQDGSDSVAASIHITYEDYNNGNFLHVLSEHHPPARIVKQAAYMFPLLTVQVNQNKQTPLHVAAMSGASHRVIDILVKAGRSACIMKDNKGRNPLLLHLRECSNKKKCDLATGDWKEECVNLTSPRELHMGPCIKVLRILSEASPEQITMCDNFGESPANFPREQPRSSSMNHTSNALPNNVKAAMMRRAATTTPKRLSM